MVSLTIQILYNKLIGDNRNHNYEPTNRVAPVNAAQELLEIFQAKGKIINSLNITILANGSMKIL